MTVAKTVDPRSVPKHALNWPAAYRLRPAAIPLNQYADSVEVGASDVKALIDLCSPVGRHDRGAVPHGFSVCPTMPPAVVSAFANPAPEWQFVPTSIPHIAVAETVQGAIALGAQHFEQFLKDTEQKACRVSFVLERFVLKGMFHDITDTEVFSKCYDTTDYSAAHDLSRAFRECGADGFVYASKAGDSAVILRAECLSGYAEERAVALEWDGVQFTRYFDYRGLFWSSLVDGR